MSAQKLENLEGLFVDFVYTVNEAIFTGCGYLEVVPDGRHDRDKGRYRINWSVDWAVYFNHAKVVRPSEGRLIITITDEEEAK